MPIKKDETGKRWVEMEVLVPGTPEQVWRAMATGPGTTAWFTTTQVEERVGGTVTFDMGPNGGSTGEVTAWEPPHRFGYIERDWAEGAPPIATEITVTARSGDRCVVRMVHSLFTSTDDWDDQVEGFENGWPAFFEVLRLYLTHFADAPAASFFAMKQAAQPHGAVWTTLTETLGLSAANVGESRATPAQPERLSGTVTRHQQDAKLRYVMLRLNEPVTGIAIFGTYGMGTTTNSSMAMYVYGDDAARHVAESAPKWQRWFDETFAAAAP